MRLHTLSTAVLAVALGLAGCANDAETPEAGGQPSATADAGTAASTAASSPTTAPTGECEPYPAELAAGLVTDKATGKTRVKGPVGEAVYVKSTTPRADGKTTYVIAIDVGGKAVVVAHPVGPNEGPEAPGPFSPVNPFSVQATGLQTDRAVQVGVKEAVLAARDCVT